MPAEVATLVEQPGLLFAIVVASLFAGASIERVRAEMRRRAWREKNPWRSKKITQRRAAPDLRSVSAAEATRLVQPDSADQLRIVMGAEFSIQPLLNKSEARVFRELDRMVLDRNSGWQVMAQVSLGEVLRCRDPDAYRCVNSKRVDLLLMDENCQPRHAVEYQGGGHHQGTAAARDAVKKEALRRAGISYHEVVAGQTTPADLRRLVEKLVERPINQAPPVAAESVAGTTLSA
ncbi:MAG: DUF2726 domain-containing protein [Rhizobiaceae bacterium]|nr:DUF2726 domain-containing protein [Rhizobiaceae bacterium]MCV0406953.1 DUF2726 domain-containing protein [Rhizobiaceae bacterium]